MAAGRSRTGFSLPKEPIHGHALPKEHFSFIIVNGEPCYGHQLFNNYGSFYGRRSIFCWPEDLYHFLALTADLAMPADHSIATCHGLVLFCFKSYPIGGLKAYAGQKKNPNPVLVD
jgi:hypothetical protein